MKKIVTMFLFMVLMTSCAYSPMDNSSPVIIKIIERHDDIYCNYYGRGNWNMNMNIFASSDFMFRDSCGKYQIGDTIKFK